MSIDRAEPAARILKVRRVAPDREDTTTLPGGSRSFNFIQVIGKFIDAVKYRLLCHVLSHMRVLKCVFAILRRIRPIMLVGNVLIVTKARDVREVLERFDDFVLGDSIEPGMPWGPFLMTVDWRDQHARERQMLQSVVEPATDLEHIRLIARTICRSRVAIAMATGRIDIVADLAEPVMVGIIADYFGIAPLDGDEDRMARAMRHLAGIIMVNPPIGSKAWFDSREDISALTQQVLDQIATARVGAEANFSGARQTLLARLVRRHGQSSGPAWFDEDWIRRYLTGLVATGGATIVRGATHAIDQMLARPEALQHAITLAESLDRTEKADGGGSPARPGGANAEQVREALRQCIYEALRFRPMLPLLVRDCPRRTVIAKGTPHARLVPAGTRVLAPPLAAMFDPDVFPDAERFQQRSIDSYFHFGFGPRHCFGKYIADIVMLEIVRALVCLPRLERATGPAGEVNYDGLAPCSCMATFEPRNAGVMR
jgi:cytochrome P450